MTNIYQPFAILIMACLTHLQKFLQRNALENPNLQIWHLNHKLRLSSYEEILNFAIFKMISQELNFPQNQWEWGQSTIHLGGLPKCKGHFDNKVVKMYYHLGHVKYNGWTNLCTKVIGSPQTLVRMCGILTKPLE